MNPGKNPAPEAESFRGSPFQTVNYLSKPKHSYSCYRLVADHTLGSYVVAAVVTAVGKFLIRYAL